MSWVEQVVCFFLLFLLRGHLKTKQMSDLRKSVCFTVVTFGNEAQPTGLAARVLSSRSVCHSGVVYLSAVWICEGASLTVAGRRLPVVA